jgi:hypothetical protein
MRRTDGLVVRYTVHLTMTVDSNLRSSVLEGTLRQYINSGLPGLDPIVDWVETMPENLADLV